MAQYIYEYPSWPHFTWDYTAFHSIFGEVRQLQGKLMERMSGLGMIKTALFIYSFLYFFNFNVHSQTLNPDQYYKNINAANAYLIDRFYDKALFNFIEAFKYADNKPFSRDLFLAGICSFKLGDTSSVYDYLMRYAELGGDFSQLYPGSFLNEQITSDCKDLLSFISSPFFKEKHSSLKILIVANKHKTKKSVSRRLNWIYFKDQFILRTILVSILPHKLKVKTMKRIDHSNFLLFKKLCLREKKFIDFSVVGEHKTDGPNSLSKVDVLLRHFHRDNNLQLDSLVRESISHLNYYPESWAQILDYNSLVANEKWISEDSIETSMRYGMFRFNRNVLFAHGGAENANIFRRNLFLPDVEFHARFLGVKVNPNPTQKFRARTRNKNWNKKIGPSS